MVFLKRNGQHIGGGEMDRITQDTTKEVSGMQERFRDRAKAIEGAQMPPLEGEMRRRWIAQKEADYQDFLMISDCDIDFTDGILTLKLDLRTKIEGTETETQIAMKNIAKATTVIKEIQPIEITDEEVTTGRNLHKEP
jgi:hypothetical protein